MSTIMKIEIKIVDLNHKLCYFIRFIFLIMMKKTPYLGSDLASVYPSQLFSLRTVVIIMLVQQSKLCFRRKR